MKVYLDCDALQKEKGLQNAYSTVPRSASLSLGRFQIPHAPSVTSLKKYLRFSPHHPLSTDAYPIITVFSSGKSYSGTSRFSGAGPFLALPETS